MKIGIDISQVVYQGSGTSSYTSNLVTSLIKDTTNAYILFGSALQRRRELMALIKSLPKNEKVDNKTFLIPPTLLSFIWNNLHIGKIEYFIGEIDVFHTSDWTEPPSMAPKITTIHDLIIYKYPHFLPTEIIETQKQKLKWVKKESRAILADSISTKNDIIYYLDIDPQRIHVVPLGVSEDYTPQTKEKILDVKNKFRIVGDYILVVGTREPRKNLTRTVKAFKKLKNNSCKLVVAGNYGWGEDIGRDENIILVGYVPNKELAVLYSGAKCFVYPSYYEGFGLPVLEAMASGTLVVTSTRGSLAEIINKQIAIIVNPEDENDINKGIKKALDLNNAERKKIIEKGVRHTKNYTWSITAEKTLEIYRSII